MPGHCPFLAAEYHVALADLVGGLDLGAHAVPHAAETLDVAVEEHVLRSAS